MSVSAPFDEQARRMMGLVEQYLPGADLLPGDPALARITEAQRLGFLSARPAETPYGLRVRVRVTSLGYALLAPSEPAGQGERRDA